MHAHDLAHLALEFLIHNREALEALPHLLRWWRWRLLGR